MLRKLGAAQGRARMLPNSSGKKGGCVVKHMRIKAVGVLLTAFMTVGALSGVGAQAAPRSSYHFMFKGTGAEGFWSSCTETRVVSCVDTYIAGAKQVSRDGGNTWRDNSASLDRVYYHFDSNGNFVFDAEDFGYGDATVSVDSKLTTASIVASLPVSSCSVDRNGNWTCSDSTADLSANFDGVGALTKVNGSYKISDGSFTETYKSKGSYRQADSQTSLNGTSLVGYQCGDIFNVSERDMYLCHGC
jgi:hypothetical protein